MMIDETDDKIDETRWYEMRYSSRNTERVIP